MIAMKKVIALLIGAALVLSFAGAAAAGNLNDEQKVEVTMAENTGDYILKLPSSLTVNQDGTVKDNGEWSIVLNPSLTFSEWDNLTMKVKSYHDVDGPYGSSRLWSLNESGQYDSEDVDYVEFGIFMTETTNNLEEGTSYGTYTTEDDSYLGWVTEGEVEIMKRFQNNLNGNIYTKSFSTLSSEQYFKTFEGQLIFTVSKVTDSE